MLYHAEQDLASLLAAWPVAEDHVIHLFELDPTHVPAQPAEHEARTERRRVLESRSSLPLCLLSDEAPAGPLLELDPVHFCPLGNMLS